MRKSVLFLITVFLLIATTAMATKFNFSYQGANIYGNGQLDATNNGNGTFTALSGSSTAFLNNTDLGIFTLIPNPNAPNYTTSPNGMFYYDNLLYSQSPFLDVSGLLFSNGSLELNIWGNGPNNFYSAWTGGSAGYVSNDDVAFTLTPVPEPGTMVLFGAGLLGLAIYGKRRMNKEA